MGTLTRRILISLAASVGVPLVLIAGLLVAMSWRFYPGAPEPDYPAPESLAEARAQDVAYFAAFPLLDRSYSDEARTRALAMIAELEPRAVTLSRAAPRPSVGFDGVNRTEQRGRAWPS